jgi:hypothetical protein
MDWPFCIGCKTRQKWGKNGIIYFMKAKFTRGAQDGNCD